MKKTGKSIERKIKVDMSVILQTAFNQNASGEQQEEFANMLAKNYVSCLGDKDIQITSVEFL